MNPNTAQDVLDLPAVVVKGESRYLIGFPLLVSVTFDNQSRETHFFDLPELDLFYQQGPMGLRLEPMRGGAPIAFGPSSYRGPAARTSLAPGEKRLMLLDLSNFGLDLMPGVYRLTLTLRVGAYSRDSDPIEVEFALPSPDDAQEAARLRRMGLSPTDTGAWAPFLKNNWNTVMVSPQLSRDGRRQLALHLFLHRALYGPTPVGRLDPAPLRQVTTPVLQGEVTALEWEIRSETARSGGPSVVPGRVPDASWAGLRARLDRIEHAEGFLTRYRKLFGAEQQFLRPPTSFPYR